MAGPGLAGRDPAGLEQEAMHMDIDSGSLADVVRPFMASVVLSQQAVPMEMRGIRSRMLMPGGIRLFQGSSVKQNQ